MRRFVQFEEIDVDAHPEVREEMMKRSGTSEALTGIYASDASIDVKKAVVNALFIELFRQAVRDVEKALDVIRARQLRHVGNRLDAGCGFGTSTCRNPP